MSSENNDLGMFRATVALTDAGNIRYIPVGATHMIKINWEGENRPAEVTYSVHEPTESSGVLSYTDPAGGKRSVKCSYEVAELLGWEKILAQIQEQLIELQWLSDRENKLVFLYQHLDSPYDLADIRHWLGRLIAHDAVIANAKVELKKKASKDRQYDVEDLIRALASIDLERRKNDGEMVVAAIPQAEARLEQATRSIMTLLELVKPIQDILINDRQCFWQKLPGTSYRSSESVLGFTPRPLDPVAFLDAYDKITKQIRAVGTRFTKLTELENETKSLIDRLQSRLNRLEEQRKAAEDRAARTNLERQIKQAEAGLKTLEGKRNKLK